jgi:hypothetical protein
VFFTSVLNTDADESIIAPKSDQIRPLMVASQRVSGHQFQEHQKPAHDAEQPS